MSVWFYTACIPFSWPYKFLESNFVYNVYLDNIINSRMHTSFSLL